MASKSSKRKVTAVAVSGLLFSPCGLLLVFATVSYAVSTSCTIKPGDDIASAISIATSTGIRKCFLSEGVHFVHRPIKLPSNFTLEGA